MKGMKMEGMKMVVFLAVTALLLGITAHYSRASDTKQMPHYIAYDPNDTYCNVRSGPGVNYNIIATLPNGEKIQPTDKEHLNWKEIILPDGRIGWIYKNIVRRIDSKEVEVVKNVGKQDKIDITPSEEESLLVGVADFYALRPLFIYENGRYRNFEEEFKVKEVKRVNGYYEVFADPTKVRKVLEEFQKTKFYLCLKGRLVGEFKATRLNENEPSVAGEVFWKVPKQEKEKIEEKISEERAVAIALSRPIEQSFWPKVTLTPTQSQELKKRST